MTIAINIEQCICPDLSLSWDIILNPSCHMVRQMTRSFTCLPSCHKPLFVQYKAQIEKSENSLLLQKASNENANMSTMLQHDRVVYISGSQFNKQQIHFFSMDLLTGLPLFSLKPNSPPISLLPVHS